MKLGIFNQALSRNGFGLYSVRVVTKTPFFPKVFVIAVNRDAIVVSC
jgi:hypothetical protein